MRDASRKRAPARARRAMPRTDNELRVTPSVLTESGNIPGVAYGMLLNAGDVYQVRPANPVPHRLTLRHRAPARP